MLNNQLKNMKKSVAITMAVIIIGVLAIAIGQMTYYREHQVSFHVIAKTLLSDKPIIGLKAVNYNYQVDKNVSFSEYTTTQEGDTVEIYLTDADMFPSKLKNAVYLKIPIVLIFLSVIYFILGNELNIFFSEIFSFIFFGKLPSTTNRD